MPVVSTSATTATSVIGLPASWTIDANGNVTLTGDGTEAFLELLSGGNLEILLDSQFGSAITTKNANAIPLGISGAVAQSVDILTVGTVAANTFRVGSAGAVVIALNAAPADAELAAGDLALWLDATNGACKLMVKAKQADGTVRTGSLALA